MKSAFFSLMGMLGILSFAVTDIAQADTSFDVQWPSVVAVLDQNDSARLMDQLKKSEFSLPCDIFRIACTNAVCSLSQGTGFCPDDIPIRQRYRDDGKILELFIEEDWAKELYDLFDDSARTPDGVIFETTDQKAQLKCQTDQKQHGCLIWFLVGY